MFVNTSVNNSRITTQNLAYMSIVILLIWNFCYFFPLLDTKGIQQVAAK